MACFHFYPPNRRRWNVDLLALQSESLKTPLSGRFGVMLFPSSVTIQRNHQKDVPSNQMKRRTPPSIFSRFPACRQTRQRDFLPCRQTGRGAILFFYFSAGRDRFWADFLFCVLVFGSFAKVSASRRVRAFANVPNQRRTKNVTKTYVWQALPLTFEVFPLVSDMLPPMPDHYLPLSDNLPLLPEVGHSVSNILLPVPNIFPCMPIACLPSSNCFPPPAVAGQVVSDSFPLYENDFPKMPDFFPFV